MSLSPGSIWSCFVFRKDRETEKKRQIFLKNHPTQNCIKGKRVGCVVVVVVVEEDRVVVAIRDLVESGCDRVYLKRKSLCSRQSVRRYKIRAGEWQFHFRNRYSYVPLSLEKDS